MSALTPFDFEGHAVRVVTDDAGEPWFVAMDVAETLGYSWQSNVIAHVPSDWKGVRPINTPGGKQQMTVLTEQGLYFFLARSDKPNALPFQRWMAGDVLPSIRRTGSFAAPGAPQPSALEPAKEFKALLGVAKLIGLDKNAAVISANQAVTRLTGTNLLGLLGQTHLEQDEQVQYFTPTELGARVALSGQKVNTLLAQAGFQAKVEKSWELLQPGRQYAMIYDTGKKHSDGVPIQQVKWSAAVLDVLQPAAA